MQSLASRFSIAALSLALVALVSACAEEGADGDIDSADTIAMSEDPDAVDEPVTTGIEAGGASTYDVAINNPMPHAMVVSVAYTGGGETELGSVPAGGEQSFTVAASGGEMVTLTATDEANTHSPSTTLTLPEGQTAASWTIE